MLFVITVSISTMKFLVLALLKDIYVLQEMLQTLNVTLEAYLSVILTGIFICLILGGLGLILETEKIV